MASGAADEVAADSNVTAKKKRTSAHGYYCCVPLCRNRSVNDPSLSFHCFPSETTRKEARKAWIVAIRREEGPNFRVTRDTRVCSAHFLPGDFRTSAYTSLSPSEKSRKLLLTGAGPSIFAWRSGKVESRRALPERHSPPAPKRRCQRSGKSDALVTAVVDVQADVAESDSASVPEVLPQVIGGGLKSAENMTTVPLSSMGVICLLEFSTTSDGCRREPKRWKSR